MCASHKLPPKTTILKPNQYLIEGEASDAFPSAKGLAVGEAGAGLSCVTETLQALQEGEQERKVIEPQ